MKILVSVLLSVLLSVSYGQGRGHGNGGNGKGGHGNGGHGNGGHGGGKAQPIRVGRSPHPGKHLGVGHKSHYRPAIITVYHPVWGPQFAYNRRWVYFPQRNLYWDNWRGHYVFWNGAIWISQPAPPAGIIVIDLHKERKKELKEQDDDIDDIYKGNKEHKGG